MSLTGTGSLCSLFIQVCQLSAASCSRGSHDIFLLRVKRLVSAVKGIWMGILMERYMDGSMNEWTHGQIMNGWMTRCTDNEQMDGWMVG